MSVTLWIASDHAGIALKREILKLRFDGFKWADLGPEQADSVDYPDLAEKLGRAVAGSTSGLGVLICGSGVGMSIAANKIAGVRAAHVSEPVSARLAREHNHANVICLGARFLAPEFAAEVLFAFLAAKPSGEGRHAARVKKISDLES